MADLDISVALFPKDKWKSKFQKENQLELPKLDLPTVSAPTPDISGEFKGDYKTPLQKESAPKSDFRGDYRSPFQKENTLQGKVELQGEGRVRKKPLVKREGDGAYSVGEPVRKEDLSTFKGWTKFGPLKAAGMIKPGNIDLTTRPWVHFPDGSSGSILTANSPILSGPLKGKWVVFPLITPDGHVQTEDEGYRRAMETGQNLGIFNDEASSTAHAIYLHMKQGGFQTYWHAGSTKPQGPEVWLDKNAEEIVKGEKYNRSTTPIYGPLSATTRATSQFESMRDKNGNLYANKDLLEPAKEEKSFLDVSLADAIDSLTDKYMTAFNKKAWERRKADEAAEKEKFKQEHPFVAGGMDELKKSIDDSVTIRNAAFVVGLGATGAGEVLLPYFAMQAGVGAYKSASEAKKAFEEGRNPEAFRKLMEARAGHAVSNDEFKRKWDAYRTAAMYRAGQRSTDAGLDAALVGLMAYEGGKPTGPKGEILPPEGPSSLELTAGRPDFIEGEIVRGGERPRLGAGEAPTVEAEGAQTPAGSRQVSAPRPQARLEAGEPEPLVLTPPEEIRPPVRTSKPIQKPATLSEATDQLSLQFPAEVEPEKAQEPAAPAPAVKVKPEPVQSKPQPVAVEPKPTPIPVAPPSRPTAAQEPTKTPSWFPGGQEPASPSSNLTAMRDSYAADLRRSGTTGKNFKRKEQLQLPAVKAMRDAFYREFPELKGKTDKPFVEWLRFGKLRQEDAAVVASARKNKPTEKKKAVTPKAKPIAEVAQPAPVEPSKVPVNSDFGSYARVTEQVPVSVLDQYKEADRSVSPKGDIESLKEQIKREGIKEPLILSYDPASNTATLGEGNTRLQAAKELGLETVPVRVVRSSKKGKAAAGKYTGPETDRKGNPRPPADIKPSEIGVGATPQASQPEASVAPVQPAILKSTRVKEKAPAKGKKAAVAPQAPPPSTANSDNEMIYAADSFWGAIGRMNAARSTSLQKSYRDDANRFWSVAEKRFMEMNPGATEQDFHQWIDSQNRMQKRSPGYGVQMFNQGSSDVGGRDWRDPLYIAPEPKTSPIPPGTVRLFHYTEPGNLEAIKKEGILKSKGRGDDVSYGGPSAGVWASTSAPERYMSFVEFYVYPNQISGNAARIPTYKLNKDSGEYEKRDSIDQDMIDEFQSKTNHVILNGDVPLSQFVAVHEPWISIARYTYDDWDEPGNEWLHSPAAIEGFRKDGMGDYVKALSVVQAIKSSNRAEGGIQMSTSGPVEPLELPPIWYLKSNKIIDEKMRGPMPADQLLRTLETNGVKPDELKYTGLEDILKSKGKEPVRPEEVRDYLAANNLQIKEVRKGGSASEIYDEWERLRERMWEEREAGNWEEFQRLNDQANSLEATGLTPTKFGQYTIPGGQNYQELLLTLPEESGVAVPRIKNYTVYNGEGEAIAEGVGEPSARTQAKLTSNPDWRIEYGEQNNRKAIRRKDSDTFQSWHWDEPNVVGHIRFNDRTGPNGEKLLHLEELQSDWHQKGRKEGYKPSKEEIKQALVEANSLRPAAYSVISKVDNLLYDYDTIAGALLAVSQHPDWVDRWDAKELKPDEIKTVNDWVSAYNRSVTPRESSVPDAPFKKTWPELLFKRMLRYAAENGYDGISWTPGEEQAERYSLAKHVDRIVVPTVDYDGTRAVRIENKNGSAYRMMVSSDGTVEGHGSASQFNGKKLDEVIGREMANKVMEAKNPTDFSGEGIKIGGEGIKGFYDKILVDLANKLGKPYGEKVGETNIRYAEDTGSRVIQDKKVPYLPITDSMRQYVMQGQPLFSITKPELDQWFGDSKVVDESGNPKVLYHGTSKDTQFKKFKIGRRGSWFTEDPSVASDYASQNDSQGFRYEGWKIYPTNTKSRVIPAFVKIERPYIPTPEDIKEMNGGGNYHAGERSFFDRLRSEGYFSKDLGRWIPRYDGIKMPGGVWVVLDDPSQIKSTWNPGPYEGAQFNLGEFEKSGIMTRLMSYIRGGIKPSSESGSASKKNVVAGKNRQDIKKSLLIEGEKEKANRWIHSEMSKVDKAIDSLIGERSKYPTSSTEWERLSMKIDNQLSLKRNLASQKIKIDSIDSGGHVAGEVRVSEGDRPIVFLTPEAVRLVDIALRGRPVSRSGIGGFDAPVESLVLKVIPGLVKLAKSYPEASHVADLLDQALNLNPDGVTMIRVSGFHKMTEVLKHELHHKFQREISGFNYAREIFTPLEFLNLEKVVPDSVRSYIQRNYEDHSAGNVVTEAAAYILSIPDLPARFGVDQNNPEELEKFFGDVSQFLKSYFDAIVDRYGDQALDKIEYTSKLGRDFRRSYREQREQAGEQRGQTVSGVQAGRSGGDQAGTDASMERNSASESKIVTPGQSSNSEGEISIDPKARGELEESEVDQEELDSIKPGISTTGMSGGGGNPEENLFGSLDRQKAEQLLGGLRKIDAQVLRMRFGFDGPPMTLDQIAKKLGLGQPARAGEIVDRAIRNLRYRGERGDFGVSFARSGRSSGRVTKVSQGRIRKTIDELVAAAESMSDWKDWYERHRPTVERLFCEDDEIFLKMLSATSQAASVATNVTLALKAYSQWMEGRPFEGFMEGVRANLDRVRNEENLRGAKISEYGSANMGIEDAIAVDRHIAELLFNTKTPNAAQIRAAKLIIGKIAKRLGWQARNVQAALWAFNQVRKGAKQEDVESYDKILERRADFIRELRSLYGKTEGGGVPSGSAAREGTEKGARVSISKKDRERLDEIRERLDQMRKAMK